MTDFEKQLNHYRLTTAEIFYHLPDHPDLLQSYLWQEYDLAPEFPELRGFLDFWVEKIEGKLHSVQMASKNIISPGEWRLLDGEFTVH